MSDQVLSRNPCFVSLNSCAFLAFKSQGKGNRIKHLSSQENDGILHIFYHTKVTRVNQILQ